MSVHGWVWSWRRVAAILVCAVAGVVGLAAQAQAATFGIGTGGALAVANPLLAPATSTTGPLTLDPVEGASFTQVMASATCQIIGTPTIDWGDGSTSSGSDTGVGSISGTHTYTEEGTYTATVTWTESCLTIRGSVPTDPTQTDTIHVSDAFLSAQGSPVNATVGSPFTGQVATFTDSDPNPNLTAADYTASIDWGDGTVSTGRISPNPSGGYQVTGSHTYAAPPTGLIVATISDRGPEGGVADQPHSTVTASTNPNVALVEAEGQQFTGQLANANCTVTSTPTINWQDGTQDSGTASGGGLIDGTHAYAEEGSYTVIVTWHDDCHDGLVTSTTTINVSDAALNNASGTPVSANAGQPFSGQVATFADSDPNGTASDYTATINWGDGTTSAGTAGGSGPFTISGTHTYAAGGSYPVSVTIADAGGATTVANTTANVTPQNSPVVFTGPPAVKTSSGAVFSGSVNPLGLPTTAYFQYGLDSSYGAAADGPTYTASTPAQPVGSDFSAHAVSATVSGLVPNAIYHVRLVASNSAGTTYGPDQTFMTSKAPPPGSPTLGKTFNLAPVSGVVLIKVNNTFVPVTELLQIPSNTEIDALHGTMELITAGGTAQTASSKGHKTQTGKFGGAIFRVAQARSGGSKGQTTLSLVEGAFAGAPTYASCKAKKASDASSPFAQAASLSSSVLQTLHASAHGRFRTRGRYSAATVRGTIWTTVDRCDGTLTSVQKDTVLVTDFVSHKTILLHTGQHYLAKAPTGRHK